MTHSIRHTDAREVALLLRQIVGGQPCWWLWLLERVLDLRDRIRRRAA